MKTTTESAGGPGSTRASRVRLGLGAVGFVGLTITVFWFQFGRVPHDAAVPQWETLRWGYLALLILCMPIETLTCALRTWVVTRVLEPRVTLWTCVKAEWANVACSTLTPTQSWGGPGQVYLLSRGGASLGTSVTIMLTGFVGTLVALVAFASYAVFVTRADGAVPLFFTIFGSLIASGSALACVALWPTLLRVPLAALSRAVWRLRGRRSALLEWWPPEAPRTGPAVDRMGRLTAGLVDLIYTYRRDAGRFFGHGKWTGITICLLSLPFPIARVIIAFCCLRFLGIEGSDFRHIFEAQLVLILFEFVAPSPGGAGMVEIASSALMASIIPLGYVPYYTLVWRATTLYVPAIAGFACLGVALLQDAPRRMRLSWDGASRSS